MSTYFKPLLVSKDKKETISFNPTDFDEGYKIFEHGYLDTGTCNSVENFLINNPFHLAWCDEYSCSISKFPHSKGNPNNLPSGLFIINHTKKEYYSRDEIKLCEKYKCVYGDQINYINPLPYLTSTYLCCIWEGDLIEISEKIPEDYKKLNHSEISELLNF